MRESIELSELYPLMAEVIAQGGSFRFYPRGTSMLPMLVEGEDSVLLAAAKDIAVGDVLFYRRDNGAFVLHRLIDLHGDKLTMCGDHQRALEYGVRREQVLARLVGFYKGEAYHSVEDAEYRAYARKMVKRFPFYRKNEKLFAFLKKIKTSLMR